MDIRGRYEQDPARAAHIQYCRMRAAGELVQWDHERRFAFGPRFVKSIHDAFTNPGEFSYDLEKLFEAVVHVLGETHDFGEGQNHQLRRFVGDGPRITKPGRGGVDNASRAYVIKAGAPGNKKVKPYRLHYWNRADDSLLFSNVTFQHDDATIYDEQGRLV